MPRLRIAVDAISTARRPKMSRPEQEERAERHPRKARRKQNPQCLRRNAPLLAISGAVKEIASTSKPSIMFRAVGDHHDHESERTTSALRASAALASPSNASFSQLCSSYRASLSFSIPGDQKKTKSVLGLTRDFFFPG